MNVEKKDIKKHMKFVKN